MRTRPTGGVFAAVMLGAAGCYTGFQGAPDGPPDLADGGDTGGDGNTGDSGSGDDGAPDVSCAGDAAFGATPLRRITRVEYDNIVRDVLFDDTQPAEPLTADELVAGFETNAVAVSAREVEDYFRTAEAVAQRAVAERVEALVDCDLASASCVNGFVDAFGRRLFRRALTDAQRERYVGVFDDVRASTSVGEGLEATITAMLTAPQFLYVLESGVATSDPDVVALDGYSVATRMSLFLWASAPDPELLDAAEAGLLDDPNGILLQAHRMLADERAQGAIASFQRQWLDLDGVENLVRDPEQFPGWTDNAGESALRESELFAQHVVLEGDATLSSLLTSELTFVDATLASLYRVPHPSPDPKAFVQVELPGAERAGVLTQAAVLARHSDNLLIHRGKIVRGRLLCTEIEPPMDMDFPDGVDVLEDPYCSSCHLLMNPVGAGLLEYDASGVFRTEDESGDPIDGQGEIFNSADPSLDGPFTGARELATKLAQSEVVGQCVSRQWLRFALRRHEHPKLDKCAMEDLTAAFIESGQDIRALMLAIVGSDAFRVRRAHAPQ